MKSISYDEESVELGGKSVEFEGGVAKVFVVDDIVVVKERPPLSAGMRFWGFDRDGIERWRRTEGPWWIYEEDGQLVQYHEFHMGGPEITLRLDPQTGRRAEVLGSRSMDDPESYVEVSPDDGRSPPYEWGNQQSPE